MLDAAADGDDEKARALVEPLHPADVADLIELAAADEREGLVAALAGMVDADVLAEMNEHVREALLDQLEPQQVADFAASSTPTTRWRCSRTSPRTSSARCCARWSPTIAPLSRRR